MTAIRSIQRIGLGLAVVAVLAVAGCAPQRAPAPAPALPVLEQRYASRLRQRSAPGMTLEADASLWLKQRDATNLPGVSARVRLAAPDAFWLRVEGATGAFLVAAARGDSLACDIRGRSLGAIGDGVGEAAGLPPVGGLAWRIATGGWAPPAAAWGRAEPADSLVLLRWTESADSVLLTVGSDGLPRQARLACADGPVLHVRYPRWRIVEGVSWPAVIVVSDPAEWRTFTCRLEGMMRRVPPGPGAGITLPRPRNALEVRGDAWLRLFEELTGRLGRAPGGQTEGEAR